MIKSCLSDLKAPGWNVFGGHVRTKSAPGAGVRFDEL